jgi:hypothetical protein
LVIPYFDRTVSISDSSNKTFLGFHGGKLMSNFPLCVHKIFI